MRDAKMSNSTVATGWLGPSLESGTLKVPQRARIMQMEVKTSPVNSKLIRVEFIISDGEWQAPARSDYLTCSTLLGTKFSTLDDLLGEEILVRKSDWIYQSSPSDLVLVLESISEPPAGTSVSLVRPPHIREHKSWKKAIVKAMMTGRKVQRVEYVGPISPKSNFSAIPSATMRSQELQRSPSIEPSSSSSLSDKAPKSSTMAKKAGLWVPKEVYSPDSHFPDADSDSSLTATNGAKEAETASDSGHKRGKRTKKKRPTPLTSSSQPSSSSSKTKANSSKKAAISEASSEDSEPAQILRSSKSSGLRFLGPDKTATTQDPSGTVDEVNASISEFVVSDSDESTSSAFSNSSYDTSASKAARKMRTSASRSRLIDSSDSSDSDFEQPLTQAPRKKMVTHTSGDSSNGATQSSGVAGMRTSAPKTDGRLDDNEVTADDEETDEDKPVERTSQSLQNRLSSLHDITVQRNLALAIEEASAISPTFTSKTNNTSRSKGHQKTDFDKLSVSHHESDNDSPPSYMRDETNPLPATPGNPVDISFRSGVLQPPPHYSDQEEQEDIQSPIEDSPSIDEEASRENSTSPTKGGLMVTRVSPKRQQKKKTQEQRKRMLHSGGLVALMAKQTSESAYAAQSKLFQDLEYPPQLPVAEPPASQPTYTHMDDDDDDDDEVKSQELDFSTASKSSRKPVSGAQFPNKFEPEEYNMDLFLTQMPAESTNFLEVSTSSATSSTTKTPRRFETEPKANPKKRSHPGTVGEELPARKLSILEISTEEVLSSQLGALNSLQQQDSQQLRIESSVAAMAWDDQTSSSPHTSSQFAPPRSSKDIPKEKLLIPVASTAKTYVSTTTPTKVSTSTPQAPTSRLIVLSPIEAVQSPIIPSSKLAQRFGRSPAPSSSFSTGATSASVQVAHRSHVSSPSPVLIPIKKSLQPPQQQQSLDELPPQGIPQDFGAVPIDESPVPTQSGRKDNGTTKRAHQQEISQSPKQRQRAMGPSDLGSFEPDDAEHEAAKKKRRKAARLLQKAKEYEKIAARLEEEATNSPLQRKRRSRYDDIQNGDLSDIELSERPRLSLKEQRLKTTEKHRKSREEVVDEEQEDMESDLEREHRRRSKERSRHHHSHTDMRVAPSSSPQKRATSAGLLAMLLKPSKPR